MKVKDLLTSWRRQVVDDNKPYLWSDAEFLEHLNDAYRMFVRLTDGIPDSTSKLTTLNLLANEAWMKVSPLILRFRSVDRVDDGTSIDILNKENLEPRMLRTDYGIIKPLSIDTTTGVVRAVVTGLERNKIRIVPIPAEDTEVQLAIDRLPLKMLATLEDEPDEIDEQHHLHLLQWVKHRAYAKEDAETFDRGKSDTFGQQFQNYCSLALHERRRKEHTPRLIQYGGL